MPLSSPSIQPKWLHPNLPREGRYVLGPLLGRGGMGEVMEAWDVVLCRTIALKALRDLEPAAMIRFVHEAQIQARVIHPNICRIYDIESADGTLRIAMQLIQGPNLEQAARQLSEEEIVTILGQMADAVAAAHRADLIHRDLKPSNIILERTADGRWVPYLCDFGLAIAVGEPALTVSQSVLGTPAYMAPEQLQGDRARICPATDVYALGGTLHYALLGYPPGQPGRAARGAPARGLHPDLLTIMCKCLEKDPEQRYPTATALAEDLRRYLAGEPIQARPLNRRERLGRLLPRPGKRLALAALATAGAALALAGGLALGQRRHLRQDALVQTFLVEGDEPMAAYRGELMLPVHDLRPARAALAQRIQEVRQRMAAAAPAPQAAAAYTLARYHLVLGQFQEALDALALAEAQGFPGAALATLKARARLGLLAWEGQPAEPGPRNQALPQPHPREPFQAALGHLEARDYAQAASDARTAAERLAFAEPAGLEASALWTLGRQRFRAGDLEGAIGRFQEARDAARGQLARWRSSPALHYALARASLALAEVDLELGRAGDALLAEAGASCEQGLRLDPEDPRLMAAWLETQFLRARQAAARGLAREPVLEPAAAFLETRVKDPADPELRAARMLVYWQLAEAASERGGDPGPALVEALRCLEPPRWFAHHYLGQLLTYKARLELTRGQDPRPTLEALQVRHCDDWPCWEAEAEGWLIRAQWEGSRALDPLPSLDKAKEVADLALRENPAAPAAHAVKAVALDLEMSRDPARRSLLLPAAREHLRSAVATPSDGARRLLRFLDRLS